MHTLVRRLLAIAATALAGMLAQMLALYAGGGAPHPINSSQAAVLVAVCMLLALPRHTPASHTTRSRRCPLVLWLCCAVTLPALLSPGAVPFAWLLTWAALCAVFALAGQRLSALARINAPPRARTRAATRVPAFDATHADALRRRVAHRARKRRNVALIGRPDACLEVIARMRRRPGRREHLLCWLDLNERGDAGNAAAGRLPLPPCADLERLVDMAEHRLIDTIWVAVPITDTSTLQQIAERFRHELIDIRLLPPLHDTALADPRFGAAWAMPAIDLFDIVAPKHGLLLKRSFDFIFALAALAALWPLFVVLAVLIKLSSPGPVFFRQWRRGRDGRPFRIYKFRSMRLHASAPGELRQAQHRDPRVTRIGALMRRSSLDELPQFINVLRGEMSVVGPRPHALEHDAQYKRQVDRYMDRYRLAPGITGWAQINGWRGETDRLEKMQARVEHDLFYLEHRSFALDVRIVLATALRGLHSPHAY
ncbi:exopolysaccharide biosynthesis polyprenyl glycosylphosphotransferase [Chitinasiproducens palmae]|uniref:Putative colanic acid biosysnthesis UDP-glucose lipid carrier transferase n=1 Tax=Chitinasiproducens palmae TaxID=1770053 RepID=A0A1H2PTV0_9BURK|nr:exopolysaccharide biosynthesis polyprenyl glycosylphosphotransferase [Chitinasiproducens palmae]SDV50559.1 putative colanic acid biosysnthesis UDP-glucose lipid carrier transferase [Chitinasiproducens palmae]